MKEIELIKDGVRIGRETYRIGELIKAVDDQGNICAEGRIEFKQYLDGEGYHDIFHLGFLVVGTEEYTLIDFVEDAKLKGWRIIKE